MCPSFPPVSAVEGIESVPSVYVCVCVIQHSPDRIVSDRNLNILDEFEGPGHRSKVKVATLKNVIFRSFNGANCHDI